MTSFSKKTLNEIRIALLMILIVLNVGSALLIAVYIDCIPFAASWSVWLTFILNILFLALVGYATGWIHGADLWYESEMKAMGYTCTDCVHKNRCMDRSRNYCCTSFIPKEKETKDGERKGSGKQGEAVPQR